MSNLLPFVAQAKTLKIAVTSTASTSGALPSVGNTIRIVNDGTATAFVSIGTVPQTATVPATSSPVATCTPILAGEDAVFSVPNPLNNQISTPNTAAVPLNISAITASGSTTLYVTVAEGM